MLVIRDEIKDYFQEVSDFAYKNGLSGKFNLAMMNLHLYGCDWHDTEKCRITLGRDFAPYSFSMLIEKLTPEGNYAPILNGGVIFHGPHDGFGDGSAPSFSVSLSGEVGWEMHT